MPEQTNFQNDYLANSDHHDNNNINRNRNIIMFLNNDNEQHRAEFLYDLHLPNILLRENNYFPLIHDFGYPPNHHEQP